MTTKAKPDSYEWKLIERSSRFSIQGGNRREANIEIHFGRTDIGIENFGTKAQAQEDCEFIVNSLNRRDGYLK